jgi:hypothetical protein
MANGNGQVVTGPARILFNKGDIPGAIRLNAAQHNAAQVRKIIGDPRLLVEQPRDWACLHVGEHPKLLELWKQHVRNQASSAAIMLQKHLAGVKGFNREMKISLQLTGRGTIYLANCPFCDQTCVKLDRIQTMELKPRSFMDRIAFNRNCDHKIPIPDGFWQFLLNVDSLIGASEPGTCD